MTPLGEVLDPINSKAAGIGNRRRFTLPHRTSESSAMATLTDTSFADQRLNPFVLESS
jgi:hypothetical protein